MAMYLFSQATQELFSESIKLDEVRARFAAERKAAQTTLDALQKKRIHAERKSEATAHLIAEIKAIIGTITDLDGAIVACKAEKTELTQQIASSMQADKGARIADLSREVQSLRAEERQLCNAYLEAMAVAAIAQMKLLGWYADMPRFGPAIRRFQQGEQKFFEAKLNELCSQAGITSSSKPMSEVIKAAEQRIMALSGAVTVADAEAEIARARQVQAEVS